MMMKIHNPLPLKTFELGYSRDCACGWRCPMFATIAGADRTFIFHVARDAASAVDRQLDPGYSISLQDSP